MLVNLPIFAAQPTEGGEEVFDNLNTIFTSSRLAMENCTVLAHAH